MATSKAERRTAAKPYMRVENATAVIWKTPLIAGQTFRRLDPLAEVAEGVMYVNGAGVKSSSATAEAKTAARVQSHIEQDLQAPREITHFPRGFVWDRRHLARREQRSHRWQRLEELSMTVSAFPWHRLELFRKRPQRGGQCP